MYDKMDDNRKIDKIEDFLDTISDTMKGNVHRYNDRLTNTIRM